MSSDMFRSFFIFVMVSVPGVGAKYYKTADVAIVVDRGPMMNEFHWQLPEIDLKNRLWLVSEICFILFDLPDVDVRVGVFTHDDAGTQTLLTFRDGVKGADFVSRIREPLLQQANNRWYDHSNFEAIVRGVREGEIKNCDGNRPASPDMVIWMMVHISMDNLPASELHLRDQLYKRADNVLEIAVNLISNSRWFYHLHVFSKTPHDFINPNFDCFQFDDKNENCALKILEAPETIAKALKALWDYCREPTGTPAGPCGFNNVYRCTAPIMYVPQNDIDPRFQKYCPNGRIEEADCPDGDQKCCENVPDKEQLPCDAPCGGQGQEQTRPRDPALHQKCTYASKPCTGPPCPATGTTKTTTPAAMEATTTTTPKTTTSTTTSTTSTAPRTTTRRRTPHRPPGQPTPHEPPEPESTAAPTPGGEVVPVGVTSATPGLKSWQITLIGIGSLLLLALLILLILCLRVRKRRKRRRIAPPPDYHRRPSHQRPASPRHHRPSPRYGRSPTAYRQPSGDHAQTLPPLAKPGVERYVDASLSTIDKDTGTRGPLTGNVLAARSHPTSRKSSAAEAATARPPILTEPRQLTRQISKGHAVTAKPPKSTQLRQGTGEISKKRPAYQPPVSSSSKLSQSTLRAFHEPSSTLPTTSGSVVKARPAARR